MGKLSSSQILSFLINIPSLNLKKSDILKIEEISDVGIVNYNYRIETEKGLLVLKQFLSDLKSDLLINEGIVLDSKDRIEISFHTANIFVEALKPDLVVPPVLYYDKGHSFLIFKGLDNIHSLKHEFKESKYNPHILGRLGIALAKIHNCSYDGKLPKDVDFINSTALEVKLKYHFFDIEKLLDNKTAKIVHDLAEDYRSRKEALIHGDLQVNNVFINNNKDKEFYVIDFELAHLGVPAFDLAHLLSEYIVFRENNPDKKELILRGLNEFRKNYFDDLHTDDPLKVEKETVKYIGVELIYRLFGLVRDNFTGYVKDNAVRERCREFALLALKENFTLGEFFDEVLAK